jgi:hypothetical protein
LADFNFTVNLALWHPIASFVEPSHLFVFLLFLVADSMGFPFTQLVEKDALIDEFTCSVCLDLIDREASLQTPNCGHLFCASCVAQMGAFSKCPACNTKVDQPMQLIKRCNLPGEPQARRKRGEGRWGERECANWCMKCMCVCAWDYQLLGLIVFRERGNVKSSETLAMKTSRHFDRGFLLLKGFQFDAIW